MMDLCKRFYAVLLALGMVFLFSACESDSSKESRLTTFEIQQLDTQTETNPLPSEEETTQTKLQVESGQTTAETQQTELVAESSVLPLVPDFTLDANNGESVSLSDYKGKIVVLNFWATWCPYCLKEMPDFKKLQEESSADEVVFLFLNQTDGQRETRAVADKWLEENGYDFLSLYDEGQVGYPVFGITSLPTTVIVDAEGRLFDAVIGQTDYDTVSRLIEAAK